MSDVPEYPTGRPKFYAMKVIREMALSGAVQTLGQPAATLITIIAAMEDQKGYRSPPDFYATQLLSLMGMQKWEALDRARRSAIEHGWLEYVPAPTGSKKPGKYWVRLPVDTPVDPPQADIDAIVDTPDPIRQTDIEGGNEGGNFLPLAITNTNKNTSCLFQSGDEGDAKATPKAKRTKKSAKADPPVYSPEFREWWEHFPRKDGKAESVGPFNAAIARLVADEDHPDISENSKALAYLSHKARRYAELVRAKGTDPQFIKTPAAWLNKSRYDDESLSRSIVTGQSSAYKPLQRITST